MNNLLSYFGLIDERISASDKDLPVTVSDVADTGAILIKIMTNSPGMISFDDFLNPVS
jgi:hypothetical protein